jgi:hypothetical protein
MLFAVGGNFYLAMSETFRIFAVAFDSQKAVSKKSIAILVLVLKSANFMREGRAFMLSLDCVCYSSVAYLQA